MSTRAGTVAARAVSFALPLPGITDACPNLPPQQPSDDRVQIRGEIRLACVRGRGVCAHHKKATARKRLEVTAHQLAEPPLYTVSGHRRANCPAHHESYPGRFTFMNPVRQHQQVPDNVRRPGTAPVAHGQRELRAASHPVLRRQDQALSFSRPLRLRAASTARPARVRMRSRNPCVLARRRLFGWNVRLLTGTPGRRVVGSHAHGLRAVLGVPTGYHLEHRRLPRVSCRRVLGCGKAIAPSCRGDRVQPGRHLHNMWIALWIVSPGLRPGDARGAHR